MGFAVIGIRAMAFKTLIGEDRPDIPVEIMRVPDRNGRVDRHGEQIEVHGMPDLQRRPVKVPRREGKTLAEVLPRIGDRIAVDEVLRIIDRKRIQLLLLRIVEAKAETMPMRLVRIGNIIV